MSEFQHAQMHVDHLYKGKIKDTIELFDDGMCDGPHLETGSQYLMYTSELPTGEIRSRGCTRSRAVEWAADDLAFLKQYGAGKVSTHISGSVSLQPDPSGDRSLPDPIPMKDVKVTLSIEGKHFSTNTNSLGEYSFTGLPPGEYDIDAEFPGHRLSAASDDVTLYPKGCIEADMTMKVDRRVQGVVRDAEGTPLSDIIVEMVLLKRGPERWKEPILLALTDGQGRYAIDGIPPGDYYLGINLDSTPTKQRPYASTYYPSTPDVAQALRIVFAPGPLTYDLDLSLPSKLPLVTVQGRVLNVDGTSPRTEEYAHVMIEKAGLSGQIEGGGITVDAEGRFEFQLCEGVPYSAFAFAGPIRTSTYSAPIEFTPTKGNDHLVLILSKTSEQFEKAREAFETHSPAK